MGNTASIFTEAESEQRTANSSNIIIHRHFISLGIERERQKHRVGKQKVGVFFSEPFIASFIRSFRVGISFVECRRAIMPWGLGNGGGLHILSPGWGIVVYIITLDSGEADC